ncbi:hypothetical protein BT69DRAFT_1350295 [Atractiella rhizophila]|nr:hypothetical protein BT69DRAFT_1350295 [Atractiella rhizophila]
MSTMAPINGKHIPNEVLFEILQASIEQPQDPSEYNDHRPQLVRCAQVSKAFYAVSRKLLSKTIIIQIRQNDLASLKRQLRKVTHHFEAYPELRREVRRVFILNHSYIDAELGFSDAHEIGWSLRKLFELVQRTVILNVRVPPVFHDFPRFQNIRVLSFAPIHGQEDEENESFRQIFRSILLDIQSSRSLKELTISNMFFPSLDIVSDLELVSLVVRHIVWGSYYAQNYFSRSNISLRHLEVSASSFSSLGSAKIWIQQFSRSVRSLHINFPDRDEDLEDWIGNAILPPMENLESLRIMGDGEDIDLLTLFPSLPRTTSLKHLQLIDIAIGQRDLISENNSPGLELLSFIMETTYSETESVVSHLDTIKTLLSNSRDSLTLFAVELGCLDNAHERQELYNFVDRPMLPIPPNPRFEEKIAAQLLGVNLS